MKSFSKVLVAALFSLLATGSYTFASAQTSDPPPAKSKPTPTQTQGKTATSVQQTNPPDVTGARVLTDREKRATAYAKLMEGQRYLATISRSNMDTNLKRAKQAFQEAATLDPTLAEAHTALAWAAFYYPPYDFDASAREASLAIGINRNNFGAHRLLSRVLVVKSGLREGNLNKQIVEKAIEELREVVRINPNDAEGWALLGEFYFATDRTGEAIDAWTRWSAAPGSLEPRFYQAVTNGRELSPESAAARLSQALLKAGRYKEATAAIRRALYLEPDNKEYLEILSQTLAAGGGNDAAAIAELQRMADANPNLTTLTTLARLQARAGRIDDAASTLRAALTRKGLSEEERVQVRVELATMLADAERYNDAVTVYEEMLKERGIGDAPLSNEEEREAATEIFSRIVNLQKSAGRMSDAVATIERMRRVLGKSDPSSDFLYVNLLRDQGKRREALAAIQAARKNFPQQSEFINLEAQTLSDLGRVDEAVTLLRAQLKGSAQQDFNTYLIISSLYTQAGRGREGVEAAHKALELAPAGQTELVNAALVTLASAQERAGDAKGSEESLRRVLDKDPDNATALNNLGYFLIERNERLTEALEMIQRAVKSEPTNSSFLDSLGWAYFKLGKLDEAERQLKEAARRDPTSSTIQDHLGDLYQKLGKTAEARAAWQKALSLSTETDETARIKAKLDNKTK